MVKLLRDLIFRQDLLQLRSKSFGEKVKFFWRKGWLEIPELMIFIPPVILATLLAGYVVHVQRLEADKLPRYFNDITIFRPNNPKVAKIRKDDYLIIESLT